MSTARRFYIYAVSGIALQAVTWSVIALLRNLFVRSLDPPTTAIAFEIAVILIGLPVFFIHWMWGQQLARTDIEERESGLRQFYLYATLAGFLGPWLANVFDLIGNLIGASSSRFRNPLNLSIGEAVLYYVLPLVVLSILYIFHQRVLTEDARVGTARVEAFSVRRLYVLGYSAVGLFLTIMGTTLLVRWIIFQLGGGNSIIGQDLGLAQEITRLFIGISLWIFFWRWAQNLYNSGIPEEKFSGLRSFYLYAAITLGALGVVGNATGILSGIFRRLLDLPPSGDIRVPFSSILGMGILWAYHAFVLREDAQQVDEFPRQAGIRRLSMYLVAGVGLTAVLVGLGGTLSVMLRSFDGGFGNALREELSWFAAGLIAGLPVWLIPWRRVQIYAISSEQVGFEERRSVVRKIYLYLFLFIGTMTVISSAVYIVFRILSLFLGESAPTLTELGQAIAFALIAIGAWIYHGLTLRSDNHLADLEKTKKLQDLRPIILDVEGGKLGPAIVDALKKENPALELETTTIPAFTSHPESDASDPAEPGSLPKPSANDSLDKSIATSGLIVGSWSLFSPAGGDGSLSLAIAETLAKSQAHKLLIPTRAEKLDWAGVDRWEQDALVRQTTHAIKQILEDKAVEAKRPMGAGAIVGIVVGGLVLLSFAMGLISAILEGF